MTISKPFALVLGIAVCGLSLALPAQAAGGHGAIAIETSTGAFGFQVDADDDASASSQAVAACNSFTSGANDCTSFVVFSSHRCGAVAFDKSSNIFAFGRGNSQAEAGTEAVNKLNGFGSVIVAQCNALAQAAAATPTPAPFVPEPIRARVDTVGNDLSPIVIYQSSIESRSDHTYVQCLSWRNIANKEVSAVKFGFRFFDEFNAAQPSFTASKDGKYTPGVNIDNICWHGTLWSAAQIRQMRVEKINVASVRFNDDTVWTPGLAWTKTFSTSGAPLPAPLAVAAQAGNAAPANTGSAATAISVGGAVGGGGQLGPTGPAFGAVAMQAATRVVGVATDQPTDDAAVYNALAKCNQQTAGANNCTVLIKFSGANKCAALAVDGNRFGTGMGPDLNNTIATALANLRANGGNIGNNIVASPCNSR